MSTTSSNADRLRELGDFMERATVGRVRKGHLFTGCVRASLAKSYELAHDAHALLEERVSFFLVPSLRSICEDLIVLAYLAGMSKDDREELTGLLMTHEVQDRLERQHAFFSTARPDQPVLGPRSADKAAVEDEIRRIWQRNGWPGLKHRFGPPVRQIAERHEYDLLTTLYDYLYRLTSGMVHFNPQVLLRSGWGTGQSFRFSPRNFDGYYLQVAQTYSLLLFSFYFELFGRFIRPPKPVKSLIAEIRYELLTQPRWPEMVTFEEMNAPAPSGAEVLRVLARVADARQLADGFLKRK